jgi:Zinc knuckle
MFDTNWQAFKSTNQLSPSAIACIEKEWISRQVHFAHYSINKYMHVNHLSSQRAESAHSKLKTWLETSTGNLFSCWMKLKETILSMHQTYDNNMSQERIFCSGRIVNDPFYSSLTRKVSRFALREVQKQEQLLKERHAGKQSKACTHQFRVVMGMPCSHELEELQTSNAALRHLGKQHFHPRWWLDKEVSTNNYRVYFTLYPQEHIPELPTTPEPQDAQFNGARVLHDLATLPLVERVLVQESIVELIANPPTLREPLTAKARCRPKGSTTLRLPPTVHTSRQLEAYNKSTRRIPSAGEDFYEIDELDLPASTAPASTKAGTRRCRNCGELGHYRNSCKKRKADCITE